MPSEGRPPAPDRSRGLQSSSPLSPSSPPHSPPAGNPCQEHTQHMHTYTRIHMLRWEHTHSYTQTHICTLMHILTSHSCRYACTCTHMHTFPHRYAQAHKPAPMFTYIQQPAVFWQQHRTPRLPKQGRAMQVMKDVSAGQYRPCVPGGALHTLAPMDPGDQSGETQATAQATTQQSQLLC